MSAAMVLACCLFASVVGIKVSTFTPGQACGVATEIQTVRSEAEIKDGAPCQLISYDDKTDVVPLQPNNDGE